MYQYDYDNLINTLILSHVVSVHYNDNAERFSVWTDDGSGEELSIPNELYGDFMDTLEEYVKNKGVN